jgi:hypothetical protein
MAMAMDSGAAAVSFHAQQPFHHLPLDAAALGSTY